MRPGPAPQPAHLKALRGNPKHEVKRVEIMPTIMTEAPECPPHLTGYAFDEWRRISAECVRLHLLVSADVNAFAAYCQAYGTWRNGVELLNEAEKADPATRGLLVDTADGKSVKLNPLVLAVERAADKMVKYAAEFGLTPAGRSRLAAGLPAQAGKFAGFIAH